MSGWLSFATVSVMTLILLWERRVLRARLRTVAKAHQEDSQRFFELQRSWFKLCEQQDVLKDRNQQLLDTLDCTRPKRAIDP